MTKSIIVIVAIIALLGFIIPFSMWMTYNNQEARLRNQAEAQQNVCKAHFDKMWKVITEVAEVPDNYKASFKETYVAIVQGRYGNARGGALLSFINESNPQFDSSLWANLQHAVEAERASFLWDQAKLLDIKREHDNLRTTRPSKWFLDKKQALDITIITSEKTEDAYKSKQENDIKLFQKGK